MEKIKGLLLQIGASDELAVQLCEELEHHDKQTQGKYETIYTEKLAQAKTICVEEVAKYKVELARKVRIFLEGKSGQIEKRLDQQRSIEEGKASVQLRRVREITEDIEVADDAELQVLKGKIKKLETKNIRLAEDKTRAIVAANRANKIALEVIERKSAPVSEKVEPKKPEKVVSESVKAKTKAKTIAKKQKTLKEGIKKTKVKAAKPKTTRRTLTASQTKPAIKRDASLGIEADNDILDIANNL